MSQAQKHQINYSKVPIQSQQQQQQNKLNKVFNRGENSIVSNNRVIFLNKTPELKILQKDQISIQIRNIKDIKLIRSSIIKESSSFSAVGQSQIKKRQDDEVDKEQNNIKFKNQTQMKKQLKFSNIEKDQLNQIKINNVRQYGRALRIGSLYATANTQDLSLQLQKINKNLFLENLKDNKNNFLKTNINSYRAISIPIQKDMTKVGSLKKFKKVKQNIIIEENDKKQNQNEKQAVQQQILNAENISIDYKNTLLINQLSQQRDAKARQKNEYLADEKLKQNMQKLKQSEKITKQKESVEQNQIEKRNQSNELTSQQFSPKKLLSIGDSFVDSSDCKEDIISANQQTFNYLNRMKQIGDSTQFDQQVRYLDQNYQHYNINTEELDQITTRRNIQGQNPSNTNHSTLEIQFYQNQSHPQKIQDIKLSTSKLTMVAQLEKYKQYDNLYSKYDVDQQRNIQINQCYSPNFKKSKQIFSQNKNNKQVPQMVPPLKLDIKNDGLKVSSFHPRTTKNNEANGIGAHSALGDLSSVRSSHRNYLNRELSAKQLYQQYNTANITASVNSNFIISQIQQIPLSARGGVYDKSINKEEELKTDYENEVSITVHQIKTKESIYKKKLPMYFNFDDTHDILNHFVDLKEQKQKFPLEQQASNSNVDHHRSVENLYLSNIFEQKNNLKDKVQIQNNQRMSFMEKITEKIEEIYDYNQSWIKSKISTAQNNDLENNETFIPQNLRCYNIVNNQENQDKTNPKKVATDMGNKSQISHNIQHSSKISSPFQQNRISNLMNLQNRNDFILLTDDFTNENSVTDENDNIHGIQLQIIQTDHFDEEEEEEQNKYLQTKKQIDNNIYDVSDTSLLITHRRASKQIDAKNLKNAAQTAIYQQYNLQQQFQQSQIKRKSVESLETNHQEILQKKIQLNSQFLHTQEQDKKQKSLQILQENGKKDQVLIFNLRQSTIKQQQQQIDEEVDLEEIQILKKLPFNGCQCDKIEQFCNNQQFPQQKKGCQKALQWIKVAWKDDNYKHFSNYKIYRLYFYDQEKNKQSNYDSTNMLQIEQDINMDLERTFQQIEYFQRTETKESLKRILLAFSNYETQVGYVQGMNFIAAILLYHAGEVAAFWLLCALMETYQLKNVLSQGLPGLPTHELKIDQLGRQVLPELFKHFDKTYVSINLFSTDWIISLFLNFIPIELSHIYLQLFFDKSWEIFYEVAIGLLKYYEKDLMKMNDAGQIVGQIKQARLGCEHLLMVNQSQQSLNTPQQIKNIDIQKNKKQIEFSPLYIKQQEYLTEKIESDFLTSEINRISDVSSVIPFKIANFVAVNIEEQQKNDTFKYRFSMIEDSRSDIMTELNGKEDLNTKNRISVKLNQVLNHNGIGQEEIQIKERQYSIRETEINQDQREFYSSKEGNNKESTLSYKQNPQYIGNMIMWIKIIDEIQANNQ